LNTIHFIKNIPQQTHEKKLENFIGLITNIELGTW